MQECQRCSRVVPNGKGWAKDVATFGLPLFHPIFISRLGTKLISGVPTAPAVLCLFQAQIPPSNRFLVQPAVIPFCLNNLKSGNTSSSTGTGRIGHTPRAPRIQQWLCDHTQLREEQLLKYQLTSVPTPAPWRAARDPRHSCTPL